MVHWLRWRGSLQKLIYIGSFLSDMVAHWLKCVVVHWLRGRGSLQRWIYVGSLLIDVVAHWFNAW
jgi:hypothetical protein